MALGWAPNHQNLMKEGIAGFKPPNFLTDGGLEFLRELIISIRLNSYGNILCQEDLPIALWYDVLA